MHLAETFTIQHFAIRRYIHSQEHIHIWVSRLLFLFPAIPDHSERMLYFEYESIWLGFLPNHSIESYYCCLQLVFLFYRFCNNYTKGTQTLQMEETAASFKAEIFSISCGLTALIPPSMPSIKTNGLPLEEDYHPHSS